MFHKSMYIYEYLIINIGYENWIVDNLTPISYPYDENKKSITIDGKTYRFKKNTETKKIISFEQDPEYQFKISGIIGADLLSKFIILISDTIELIDINNLKEENKCDNYIFESVRRKELEEKKIDCNKVKNNLIFKANINGKYLNVLLNTKSNPNYISINAINNNYCRNDYSYNDTFLNIDYNCGEIEEMENILKKYKCNAIISLKNGNRKIYKDYIILDYLNNLIFIN